MAEFIKPGSLKEALEARAAHGDYQILAGGTDLMVASKFRSAPFGSIDIFGLSELVGIDEVDGGLRIGAATTYARILGDERVQERYPLLIEAVREIGAPQIQSRGTMGGNIANSSPVGDTLPVLLALDAELELGSTSGTRRVPYREFTTGYRRTDLREDELIVAIHLPSQSEGCLQYWRKMGTRRAQSISKVMVAGVGGVEDGLIREVRIGLGAVAETPVRAYTVEKTIKGRAPDEETAELAAEILRSSIKPIDDVRSSAAYRLKAAEKVVARFILKLGARGD